MANPNIVNVTSIYGTTTYLSLGTTSATTWTALTPVTGTVNKIGSITATNVSAGVAAITVSINTTTTGSGTSYRIAYQISVPAYSSLIVLDKSTSIYVGETQSIVVTAGTANTIEMVATFEAIS